MFRLAHISDIHLGPLPKVSLTELATKRVTGYVNWHRNRGKHLRDGALDLVTGTIHSLDIDHVAITGDLVNLATRMEIDNARGWLEKVFEPARTTVVPGNHDAYVPGAFRDICDSWKPWLLSGEDRPAGHELFPTFSRRGQVALVGISTANATMPFMATGDFDSRQAETATRFLANARREGLFRVVLIHHPPVYGATSWHKRLRGISRFARMIRNEGAELVLHGHTHLDSLYYLPGPQGQVPVVGISSASQGPGHRKPPAGFNLFEISGGPSGWRLNHHRFSLAADGSRLIDNQHWRVTAPIS